MLKIKSLIMKVLVYIKEKKYYSENHTLRYILEKHKSNNLIVVFSSFPGKNKKGKYNYIRTLRNINANKLFILDNFGYNQSGSFYLGENGNFFIEKLTNELIAKVKKDLNITKTIFLGSCKGGTASIYFGIKNKVDCIIAGVPIYHIGNYLKVDWHKDILISIMGNTNEESIDKLNLLLPNVVSSGNGKSKIYLHYSHNEDTYKNHIINLIENLEKNHYVIEEDIQNYKNHNDVGLYFPNYIRSILQKELNLQ